MSDPQSFFRKLPLFPLFTGISLAIGLIVPSIFEWTQKPASRSRHDSMEQAAVAVLAITILACLFGMWLRRNQIHQPAVHTSSRKLQFGLRDVFIAITLTGVVLGVTPLLKAPLASGLITAVAIAIVGWAFACGWQIRSRVGAMLVSTFLPFTWMIAFNVPFGRTSGLAVNIPIGPGVFYATLVHNLIGLSMKDAGILAVVIVIAQLLIGAWLARRGGRLSVIYVILVFVSSGLSSLMLHVLYRA